MQIRGLSVVAAEVGMNEIHHHNLGVMHHGVAEYIWL